MDKSVKNDEKRVMLVMEIEKGQGGKMKAVSSIDEKGNIKTIDPTTANIAKLFNLNTNGPAFELFLTIFLD